MTVSELISELQKYDSDMDVHVYDGELDGEYGIEFVLINSHGNLVIK